MPSAALGIVDLEGAGTKLSSVESRVLGVWGSKNLPKPESATGGNGFWVWEPLRHYRIARIRFMGGWGGFYGTGREYCSQ